MKDKNLRLWVTRAPQALRAHLEWSPGRLRGVDMTVGLRRASLPPSQALLKEVWGSPQPPSIRGGTSNPVAPVTGYRPGIQCVAGLDGAPAFPSLFTSRPGPQPVSRRTEQPWDWSGKQHDRCVHDSVWVTMGSRGGAQVEPVGPLGVRAMTTARDPAAGTK